MLSPMFRLARRCHSVRRPFLVRALIGAAAWAVWPTPAAQAIDYTWNNTTGNWNDGTRWAPGGGPPVSTDNAFLLGAVAYTTTLNDDRAITNLTLNNTSAILDHTGGTFTVGGTITLTAGTYRLGGGTISGGSITRGAGGTGRLLVQNNGNNRLNNVAIGVGVLDFSTSAARVRLQGTTTLAAGTVVTLSGGSNVLAFEQTVTVNNLAIDLTGGNASVSVEGNNTLTLGPAATVTHSSTGNGTLGNEVFVGGTATVLNQGLVRNTAASTLTINPEVFTNQTGGIVRATAGAITLSTGGVVNAAGGVFDVNGGTFNLTGTGWSNAGTITLSSGTLNLGGSFTTPAIGTVTRTGGVVTITGAMDNAANLALTAATGSYQLAGGTITGGAISAAGGSTLQIQNNSANRLVNVAVGAGVLDFSTSAARVRLQGTTALAAGTVVTLSGGSNVLAFEQTVTVNNLAIDLTGGNASVSVEGNNTLTLGPAATVTHSSTGNGTLGNEVFVGGTATVLNQGLVRNTAASTLTINPEVFTNQTGGIVRATAGAITLSTGGVVNAAGGVFDVNGGTFNLTGTGWSNAGTITLSSGTLNLGGSFTTPAIGTVTRTGGVVTITGAMDNAANLALTAATGSYQLAGGTITGGAISAAGGSTLQIQNNSANRLVNVAVGAGVLDFSTSAARVRLQGTTTLAAGTVVTLSGGSNVLAFEQTVTVNNLAIDLTGGNASVSVEGNNTLTLGPAATVTHSSTGNGTLGNEVFVGGTATVLNQGLVRNTAASTLTINPEVFTNQTGGIVRATAGAITLSTGGVVNAAGGVFDVNGGTFNLTGTGWSNAGTITLSSGTLNLGGSFTTPAIGTVTRTGGVVTITGAMDNAANLALTAATGSYQLAGGTITGGAISAAGGSTLQIQNNSANRLVNVAVGAGVLDFSTSAARVRLQGTTALAAGTVVTLSGGSNVLAFEQTVTVNNLAIDLTGGNASVSVEGNNTLTLGPAATVTHSSTGNGTLGNEVFVGGTATVLNQGLVRNTAASTLTINPEVFTNQTGGIVRATAGAITLSTGGVVNAAGGVFDVNGGTFNLTGTGWSNAGTITLSSGTLNLGGSFTTPAIGTVTRTGGVVTITGAMDNAANLALTAATGSYQLAGGTITGGAISAAGGSTLQIQNNSANRLVNVAVGAGVLDFSTSAARVRLQGTTALAAGTVVTLSGGSNVLAFEQTVTVNNLAIDLTGGNASVSVEGNNTLTLGPAATVTHSSTGNGTLGNEVFVGGTATVLNQGLVRNTAASTLTINPEVFTNQTGGIVRATAGAISIPITTNLTNIAGTTLTGGTWEAAGSINFNGRTVNTIAAATTVTLDGAGSTFVAVNTVTANAGTFNLLNGRAFTVSGGTLTNTGSVQVGTGANLTGNVNTTAGTVSGAGTITGNVVFAGTGNNLRPGTSPGNLTVAGNLTLNATTTVHLELNGATFGTQHDRVTVTGATNAVTLGGAALNVTLGFDPTVNQQLFVVDNQTNNGVTGTFAGQAEGSTFVVTNPGTGNQFTTSVFYAANISNGQLSGGNDIVFVFTPVPEPVFVLLACAAGVGVVLRRRGAATPRPV